MISSLMAVTCKVVSGPQVGFASEAIDLDKAPTFTRRVHAAQLPNCMVSAATEHICVEMSR